MEAREVAQRFLASVGRPAEAEQYLRIFRSEAPERFALVFVSDDIVRSGHNVLRGDLRFLQQLSLTPVLCVRTEALRDELLGRGIESARASTLESVRDDIQQRAIPTLVADRGAPRQELCRRLAPHKVVVLRPRSGLQPVGARVRSLINLTRDYEALHQPGVLPDDQRSVLEEIGRLFAGSEHHFTVSVTSPFDLFRELFTVKGAGTLVRRGAEVTRHAGFDELERQRFDGLLESAFGKVPVRSFYSRTIERIYVGDDYRGAVVIEERDLAPYMSKFAVDIRARGEGIGGDLWEALCSDLPRFFWRSRPNNPINSWYAKRGDGMFKHESWHVFWKGLGAHELGQAVELATRAPVDFESPDSE